MAWALLQHFPHLAGENATPATFVLAIGIAIGVTALPVLGAILIETRMIEQPLGRLALGYATVNDGILWVLVSVLLALSAGSAGGKGQERG